MSITTKDIVGLPPSTVIVLTTRYPKSRRPVYCIHCGAIIYFSYKRVRVIIQGVAEADEVENELRCPRCKAIFEIC